MSRTFRNSAALIVASLALSAPVLAQTAAPAPVAAAAAAAPTASTMALMAEALELAQRDAAGAGGWLGNPRRVQRQWTPGVRRLLVHWGARFG